MKGLYRFADRPVAIRFGALETARRAVQKLLSSEIGFSRAMSFEEAVSRILLRSGKSSAGFYWNKYGQTKGEVLSNPLALEELRKSLNHEYLCRNGVFTMSLKDELRDFEMGEPKDARVFMPVDLVLLIATVMCYGKFNDKYVDAQFEGGLGGSFLTGGAQWLSEHLSCGVDLNGEGDAHKYDSRQNSFLRQVVYSIRAELTEDTALKATVNLLHVYPRFHLPDGSVWRVTGNPSGTFDTLVMNSILTLLVICYAEARMFGTVDWERVRRLVTGDDYLYRTSEPTFTPAWLADCAEELGLEFDRNPLRSFSESTFCQHRFVSDGGVYVAVPVDSQRLFATMALNRCGNAYETALMSQSVLIEYFYDGESRRLLRGFQDYLKERYLIDIEYMTDFDIDQLHKSRFVYEDVMVTGSTSF